MGASHRYPKRKLEDVDYRLPDSPEGQEPEEDKKDKDFDDKTRMTKKVSAYLPTLPIYLPSRRLGKSHHVARDVDADGATAKATRTQQVEAFPLHVCSRTQNPCHHVEPADMAS